MLAIQNMDTNNIDLKPYPPNVVSWFLVTCTQLYELLWDGRLVHLFFLPTVCPTSEKNIPNWDNKAVSVLRAISNINAPAQKHATDDAMYTALFFGIYYSWLLLQEFAEHSRSSTLEIMLKRRNISIQTYHQLWKIPSFHHNF